MDIFGILTMVGGLALFLFGMNAMGQGLEKLSGSRLERILEKMTSNPFKAIMLGALVTAVIQSSSATTVMVVGFVNSGIMRLSQAIGVIMGANIGTTMTSWLLSLTGIQGESIFMQLLKPTSFTPILAIIGIFFIMMSKSSKKKDIGTILMGFAILMFGMETMSSAVAPLADNEQFKSILTMFSNPVLGVIAGAVLTAVIQSSSASVGILQAMCATGAVTYSTALPIIMGQNIGTCVTALLSAIGANKNAKRAAMIHLYFNLIGTVLFMAVFYTVNAAVHFSFMPQAATPAGIAILHSAFNVTATLVLLPFGKWLEKLACLTIRDKKEETETAVAADPDFMILESRFLEKPSFAVEQSRNAAKKMAEDSHRTLFTALDLLKHFSADGKKAVEESEKKVDRYEDELGTYLVKLNQKDLSVHDSHSISIMLHCIGDFERISDHAVNVVECVQQMQKEDRFPEFYERLQALKVSVIPCVKNGIFLKKVQTFNNSIGSLEQGGNLIVQEQWLEKPEWLIYVLLDCEESEKLAEMLEKKQSIYIPYLGKNDHSADILEVERVEVETTDPAGQRIDSLFPEESFLMDELEAYSFKYRETLPVGLKEETNQYEYRKFAFSDEIVEEAKQTVFQVQGKNIIFY